MRVITRSVPMSLEASKMCAKSPQKCKTTWEQRKLGDVVDIRSGREQKHLSNGDIPV